MSNNELDELFQAFESVLSESPAAAVPALLRSPDVPIETRNEALRGKEAFEDEDKGGEGGDAERVEGFGEHESDEDVFADLERELGLSLASGNVSGTNVGANDNVLGALGALETTAATDLTDFARSLASDDETSMTGTGEGVTSKTMVDIADPLHNSINSVDVIATTTTKEAVPTTLAVNIEIKPSVTTLQANKDMPLIRSPMRDIRAPNVLQPLKEQTLSAVPWTSADIGRLRSLLRHLQPPSSATADPTLVALQGESSCTADQVQAQIWALCSQHKSIPFAQRSEVYAALLAVITTNMEESDSNGDVATPMEAASPSWSGNNAAMYRAIVQSNSSSEALNMPQFMEGTSDDGFPTFTSSSSSSSSSSTSSLHHAKPPSPSNITQIQQDVAKSLVRARGHCRLSAEDVTHVVTSFCTTRMCAYQSQLVHLVVALSTMTDDKTAVFLHLFSISRVFLSFPFFSDRSTSSVEEKVNSDSDPSMTLSDALQSLVGYHAPDLAFSLATSHPAWSDEVRVSSVTHGCIPAHWFSGFFMGSEDDAGATSSGSSLNSGNSDDASDHLPPQMCLPLIDRFILYSCGEALAKRPPPVWVRESADNTESSLAPLFVPLPPVLIDGIQFDSTRKWSPTNSWPSPISISLVSLAATLVIKEAVRLRVICRTAVGGQGARLLIAATLDASAKKVLLPPTSVFTSTTSAAELDALAVTSTSAWVSQAGILMASTPQSFACKKLTSSSSGPGNSFRLVSHPQSSSSLPHLISASGDPNEIDGGKVNQITPFGESHLRVLRIGAFEVLPQLVYGWRTVKDAAIDGGEVETQALITYNNAFISLLPSIPAQPHKPLKLFLLDVRPSSHRRAGRLGNALLVDPRTCLPNSLSPEEGENDDEVDGESSFVGSHSPNVASALRDNINDRATVLTTASAPAADGVPTHSVDGVPSPVYNNSSNVSLYRGVSLESAIEQIKSLPVTPPLHVVVLGVGARHQSKAYRPEVVQRCIAMDDARCAHTVRILLSKGIKNVSILDGGFSALHPLIRGKGLSAPNILPQLSFANGKPVTALYSVSQSNNENVGVFSVVPPLAMKLDGLPVSLDTETVRGMMRSCLIEHVPRNCGPCRNAAVARLLSQQAARDKQAVLLEEEEARRKAGGITTAAARAALSTAAVTGKKFLGAAMQRASTMSKQADVVFDGLVASASDAVDRLRADLNIVPSELPTLDDAVLNPTTTIAEAKQRAVTATAGIVNAIRVGSESAREGLREKAGGALEAYKAVASDLKIRASEAIAKGKEAVGDRPASLLLNQLASLSSVPQPSTLVAPFQQKTASNNIEQVVSGGGEIVEEETLKEAAGFAIGAADEEDVNSPSASSTIPPAGISSFSSSSSSSSTSARSDQKPVSKGLSQPTATTNASKIASGASAAARTLLSGAKSALLSAAEVPPSSPANATSTSTSSVIGAGLKRLNAISGGVVSISQLVASSTVTASSSSSSSGSGGKIVDSLRTLASVPVATNSTSSEPKNPTSSFRVTASTLFEAAKSKIATAASVPQATSPGQATSSASVVQASSPQASTSSSPVLSKNKRVFSCKEEITKTSSDGSQATAIEMYPCNLELFADNVAIITESSPSRSVTKSVKVRSLEKVSTSKKRPERLALVFSKPPVVVIADDNDDDDNTGKDQSDASLNRVVLVFNSGEEASTFLIELQEAASFQ